MRPGVVETISVKGRPSASTVVEREEAEGVGEAPYPPNFPKMPGEPKRVQPSRARKDS